MKYYDKLYNKAQKTLTNKALKKFVKSDYLRDTTSILPLTLLTLFARGIFNFLITSRIKTNYIFLDFPLSVSVTVLLTLFSPILYNHISKTYDKEIKVFSKNVIDSYYTQGWIFIEIWKSRILGSIGMFTILILFFVEINSFIIQEFIFHTMISSIIVDYLTSDKRNDEMDDGNIVKVIETPKKIDSYKSFDDINLTEKDVNILDYQIIQDYSIDSRFVDMNIFDDSDPVSDKD